MDIDEIVSNTATGLYETKRESTVTGESVYAAVVVFGLILVIVAAICAFIFFH